MNARIFSPKLSLLFGLLFCAFSARSQYTYTVVKNDPDKLRVLGITFFGYLDTWRPNPNGGFGGGVNTHFGKYLDFDLTVKGSTNERIYKKDSGMESIRRFVLMGMLAGINIANAYKLRSFQVNINGGTYQGYDARVRNSLCLRLGFMGLGSGYDNFLDATYTNASNNTNPSGVNRLSAVMVPVGLSWKNVQNLWINVGGGDPIPNGHFMEFFFDGLILVGLDMGWLVETATDSTYEVQPDEKQKFGWRTGFRLTMPIRSGVTLGMDFGSRPGAGGGVSAMDRTGYFNFYFGFYLAPGKKGE
jgi:hypothetical protein